MACEEPTIWAAFPSDMRQVCLRRRLVDGGTGGGVSSLCSPRWKLGLLQPGVRQIGPGALDSIGHGSASDPVRGVDAVDAEDSDGSDVSVHACWCSATSPADRLNLGPMVWAGSSRTAL